MLERQRGSMLQSLTLVVILMVCGTWGEPYQCAQLTPLVPTCSCEARVFKGDIINNQVVINCRNLNLSSIPDIKGTSDHVIYEMTLAQNNIQSIPAAAFNGLKIQRIDLRKNRLLTFSNDSFQGLEDDLKELYLGAESGANIRPPTASLQDLRALNTLHLEHFTFTENALEPGVLNILTRLTALTLKNNKLEILEPLSFPSSLISLTLDHQLFASFPVDSLRTLNNLESLTITNTDISYLFNKAVEKNPRLIYLDLSNNRINSLEPDCFTGIYTSLKTLSLSNNPLTNVTALEQVRHLSALTTLHLTNTFLSSLPQKALFLQDKDALTTLHLDRNSLTTLEPNVFSTLGSLQELNLGWNLLSSWGDEAFAGLTSLTHLDLSHQTGTPGVTLPASLTRLSSLQTLRLSKTIVNTNTVWGQLSPLASLQVLQLDGTGLTALPDLAFANLTQLQEVNLDNNNLQVLTQQMIAGPRGLQQLTLNKNKITEVSHCVFHGFTLSPPLYLELIDNPLNCDCQLRWLLEKRDAGSVNLSGAETCRSPADKNGTYLVGLQPAELICVPELPLQPCLELYTTTTTSPTTPSLGVTITFTFTNVSITAITIKWEASDLTTVSHFKVLLTNLETTQVNLSDNIDAADTSYQATGLVSNSAYSLCVFAFDSVNNEVARACQQTKTLSDGSADKQDNEKSSTDTGLIVGIVVGVVILLAIIAIIMYLVVVRKRCSRDMAAQPQPHVFTPSELPTMTSSSRQFTKPQERPPPKVGRALDEIKVTVISDGQTVPGSPRHSVGSYQFLDDRHPNPNPNMAPTGPADYTNGVDSRPLPTAPNHSVTGYYNRGH
ncbi:uncharacterized protein LOC143295670 [Babylonia areolata]|uniref:uncharacterized protein LOC143295670 n=1 Tax=Babylonia areolata TaxID=304850 RepID=UPI003FD2B4B0